MDKKVKEEIRKSLRKPKMYPYFVYFPKKKGMLTGKDALLEFQKTKSARDARVKELKKKRGQKHAFGIVEPSDDGPRFYCLKQIPEKMNVEIKAMAKKIPELQGYAIAAISDKEAEDRESSLDSDVAEELAEDLHETEAIKARIHTKVKNPDVRQQALDAIDRLDKLARVLSAAEKDYKASDALGPPLKAYAGRVFDEMTQGMTGQKRAGQTAEEEVERLKGLEEDERPETYKADLKAAETAVFKAKENWRDLRDAKKQLEERWGRLMAIRAGARDHLREVLSLVLEAQTLRDKVDGPKSLGRYTAKLPDIESKLGVVQGECYRFREEMVELQKEFATFSVEDAPVVIPPPVRPREVVGSDVVETVPLLERLHDTGKELLANPLRTALLEKLDLFGDIDGLPVPEEVGEDGKAAYLDDLKTMVLTNKLTAAKIRGLFGKVGGDGEKMPRLVQALIKGGQHSSSDVAAFVQGIQAFYVEVESKYENFEKFNVQLAKAHRDGFVHDDFKPWRTFPSDRVGASIVTRTGKDGKPEVVKLTSTGRVIVVGGGPIGLMSALEALAMGGRITVFEGRPNEYTRQNVLKLDNRTVNRLEKYGFYKLTGQSGPERGLVKVADLEDNLAKIVSSKGIRIIKGKGVSALEKDEGTGQMVCIVDGKQERCDLVVVAVGSGIANANKYAGDVVMSEQLGIDVKAFGLADHVLSANLDKSKPIESDVREKDPLDDGSAWSVVLETPEEKYVLTQLTESEYKRVEGSTSALKALVLERAKADDRFRGLDVSAVGRFKVVIQRASSFRGKDMSAVVVGDSAGTPHPEAGSGTNTGALETDAISDLVRGLVDKSERRFGKGREDFDTSLDEYDERLEEIISTSTAKGMANMLSVRVRRAQKARYVVSSWRNGLPDDPPKDDEVTRILSDMSLKIAPLQPSPSKDPEFYEDWNQVHARGVIIEELDQDLRTLYRMAQNWQFEDPHTRDEKMLERLQRMVYIVD